MKHQTVVADDKSKPARSAGFSVGDFVTKRSGAMPFSAEVRSTFSSSKGKPLVALEYPGGIFRVARPQQLVKEKDSEKD